MHSDRGEKEAYPFDGCRTLLLASAMFSGNR
jgi:hypothetical protein